MKGLSVELTFLEDIKMYEVKTVVLSGTAITYRYVIEGLDIEITTVNHTIIFDGRGVSGRNNSGISFFIYFVFFSVFIMSYH